jgi:uncharacterized membrane-anchored protein
MHATRPLPRRRDPVAPAAPAAPPRPKTTDRLLKVPHVAALFWIVKILTTGLGESASDFLAQKTLLVPGLLGGIGLIAGLVLQIRSPRYHAPTYWFTVAMVAVFGTVVADLFNPMAGGVWSVPLPITAAGYAAALAACLTLWKRTEGTLSIHAIRTPRREAFYWATVLLTFALGTAAGDLTAFYLNWGFATSIECFAAAILVPAALWRAGVNPVLTFWMAYILTRPLGASVADELGKDKPLGLGFGDGRLTALGTALVIALVTYLWRSKADDPQARAAA